MEQSRPDPLLGRVIDGRYRVVDVIAEGGMGVVYRGEHTVIGRKVAVKVLRRELAADGDVAERFLEEARTAGTMGHPNIVECTDFGTTNDDRPYLVMELLTGQDLGEELRRTSPFPIRRVVAIARQVASALAAAHARHIVHRDLKPENVFLVEGVDEIADHVKILDFGISKFLNRANGPKTQRGLTMGTPDFMAPEQLTDPDAVDARSDIHALGGLIYEMLVARGPFSGGSYQQVVTRILSQPPRPLDELRDDVPAVLRDLVMRCLAKDPAMRPQTMREVMDVLGRLRATTATPVAIISEISERIGRAPTEQTLPVMTTPNGTPVAGSQPALAVVAATNPSQPALAVVPGAIASQPALAVVSGAIPSQPMLQVVAAPSPSSHRLLLSVGAIALLALGGVAALMITGRGSREPAAHGAPTPAPPPPVAPVAGEGGPTPTLAAPGPTKVLLEVSSSTEGATLMLRGQAHPLPFSGEVEPGTQPELIEITAPKHEGRRLWVTLDRGRYYDVVLPAGAGISTASEAELATAVRTSAHARAERDGRREPTTPSTIQRASTDRDAVAQVAAVTLPNDAAPPTVTQPIDAGPPPTTPTADVAPATGTAERAVAGPRPGTIDAAGVKQVVRSHAGEISTCYERARMANHSQPLRGKLTVQVSVDGAGSATAAKVATSTVGATQLEACVVDAVRRWRFPAPAGAVAATFTYPFVFQ